MAKKKRKKKSMVVPVLKFVGIMAAGGVIGHYATKAWIKHVDPERKRRGDDEDLEPVDNPTTLQGFVQPALPQMQPMQIAPIIPMALPFPQFMPMAPMQAAPAPAPVAAAPRVAEVLTRAEALRAKRRVKDRDATELLARISADLDAYYELPQTA